MMSLGVNMFSQSAVRLGRFLAFSTGDSTTMLRVTTLLQLYISIFRPHLDYTSAIWSSYLKARTKLSLKILKNLHATWLLDYGIAVTKIS